MSFVRILVESCPMLSYAALAFDIHPLSYESGWAVILVTEPMVRGGEEHEEEEEK